jgi:hypothetical protein
LPYDRRLVDAAAIHVGPVRAVHVGDDEPPISIDEPSVSLRNVPLRKHEVVALDTTDADLRLVERFALLRTPLLADHDGEHGSLGTAAVREHSWLNQNLSQTRWILSIDLFGPCGVSVA